MRINVNRVINGHFTDKVELLRYEAKGAMISGIWKDPKAITLTISASVQPFQMHELNALPEGVRDNEWLWVYTREQLYGSTEGKSGDIFVWRGHKWKVARVEEWKHGGYTRAMATKMKEPA